MILYIFIYVVICRHMYAMQCNGMYICTHIYIYIYMYIYICIYLFQTRASCGFASSTFDMLCHKLSMVLQLLVPITTL